MSQPANRYRKPTPSWRNDPDIISMETRILPKNTPPMAAPSGPKATRVFPLVQLPVRSTSSSATPECSLPPFGISQKRPRPLNSSMDPVHLKRHRIDVLEHSPEPKYEPDQPADYASQMGDHTMVAETRAASESGNKGMTEPVDNLASKTAAREASYISNLGLEVVFFRFGDKMLPSSVHRKLLRDRIPRFEEEIKSLQPLKNEYTFPEDMQDTIELLLEWCYKQALPKANKDSSTPQHCYSRIKLYCFASRYEHVELMNDSMGFLLAYLQMNRPRWDVSCATYAYNNTNRGSPLRDLVSKWLMNKFFSTGDKGRWTTDAFTEAVYGDPDLLRDVMAHMRSLPDVNFANPKKDSPAIYHVEVVAETVQLAQSISAESPSEERVLTPDPSDGERYDLYDVDKVDADLDLNTEEVFEDSFDDNSPLVRRGRRGLRSGERSFTAPR